MSGSFVIASRVWQTTATTGTGDISFDASVPTGYRSFVSAIGNGNLCPYAIDDGVNWEIGIGTVSSGTPDSMARTTVKSNSLGTTAKINFGTGTKTVKVCPTGSSYVYLNSAASTDNLLIASSSGGFDPITISAALKKLLTTDGDVALNDSGTVVRASVATALKKLLTTDGDIAQNISGTVVRRTKAQLLADLRATSVPAKFSNFVGYSKAFTNTTLQMLGLGSTWTLTPVVSGKVRIAITGYMATNAALGTMFIFGNYGTGTAPASGAASTGTSITTKPIEGTAAVSGGPWQPFLYLGEVSGLTLSTAYWFDICAKVDAGAADLEIVSVVIEELPY